MRLSDLLKKDLDALLLTFFNINEITISSSKSNFSIHGSFKKSKHSTLDYIPSAFFPAVAKNLQEFYDLPFEANKSGYFCIIENDLFLTFDEMIKKLRTAITVKIANLNSIDTLDEKIATAIMILRGSPDFKLNFIAIDIKAQNQSDIYLDTLFRILTSSNELLKYLNWNFREFQEQYISGENKRNTQLRINLRWAYTTILKNYERINPYKYDILFSNEDLIGNLPTTNKMYETFIARLGFYREKIFGKKFNETEIKILRNDLFNEKNSIPRRKQQVILYIKNSTKDICSACHTKYNISDRSFIMPSDGRYYLEYHHVISYSNNRSELDIPDNLVKLCPTCHRAMSPNRANSDYQKELISCILSSREDILTFTKEYLRTDTIQDTIEKIHSLLA